MRGSSVLKPNKPPTKAKSVPCPLYVLANDSYKLIFIHSGSIPNNVLAASPIRAAPAVCELEGPIITGPMISNTELNFTITPPLLNSSFLLNSLYQNTIQQSYAITNFPYKKQTEQAVEYACSV